MRKFDVQSPKEIRDGLGLPDSTRDYFWLFDAPSELADYVGANCRHHSAGAGNERNDWAGGDGIEDAIRKARHGDLANVAASDKLLSQFERFAFETERKAWIDDVTGAIPNVPAYLAGHPLNMRRRQKQGDAAAPIAIVVDLATSASLNAEKIRRRGAAILALVRVLSARRPVELWAGCLMNTSEGRNCVATFARIETAPLDIATAAYVLTSASFHRTLCYRIQRPKKNVSGNWAYRDQSHDVYPRHMGKLLAPAFSHASKTIYVPPMLGSSSQAADAPERWIEARLQEAAADFADAA